MSEAIDRLPIIKVWNQILVPLQGQITDAVAERLLELDMAGVQTSLTLEEAFASLGIGRLNKETTKSFAELLAGAGSAG
ncbi:hypothetical protein [Labilithrix luteola]|nr:hypothetical protein [Labilithrix luteola]